MCGQGGKTFLLHTSTTSADKTGTSWRRVPLGTLLALVRARELLLIRGLSGQAGTVLADLLSLPVRGPCLWPRGRSVSNSGAGGRLSLMQSPVILPVTSAL